MRAVTDGVTLGIAITGAILGIINTWRAFDRDRIKVKIIPKWFFSASETGLCFDVINLSYVPVTIAQVAIGLDADGQIFAFIPRFMDNSRIPYRLEGRASFTVFMPPGTHNDPLLRKATRPFAATACGRTFYGSSPAFDSHIAKLRATR